MLLLASTALCAGAPIAAGSSAAGSSSDAQATRAYLLAQYKLMRTLVHNIPADHGAENAAGARIAGECHGVLSGMPQPTTLLFSGPPRARGENARASRQQQTIEAELATALDAAGTSVDRPADETYVAEVDRLSWSDPAIASLVQNETAATLEAVSTPAPSFCADARAWAQSGYRALSAASHAFETARAARDSSRRQEHSSDTLLKPYENASDRALIRKIGTLTTIKLLSSIVDSLQTVSRLGRALGLPKAANEEFRKSTPLGHGRTAAGTRFSVSSGGPSGLLGVGSRCHRSVSVSYSQPGGSPELLVMGGPNNPICLSSPHERHPALFCEDGLETIQGAVPASVRSVRLVLSDGRTIESRVVHVPRRDGGPAGIYAQEIRGRSSHAVSLVELNANDDVVLALDLPRYRCVKPRKQVGLLRSVDLASAHTPEGEPFTISASGASGELFLDIDGGLEPVTGAATVGPRPPKTFPWSLAVGCAPHPYAILYGILAPPGAAVTAQTPEGAVALNVVPIEPRVRAKGPLVYGVFSALPSELTVLGANGSTVYTENLQKQATEVTQFCEGYAEP